MEFLRLRSMNINISTSLLVEVGKYLLTAGEERFGAGTLKAGQPLIGHINAHWIQTFRERYDVVSRKLSGKLAVSVEKQSSTERAVAYYLGKVQQAFDSGVLDDDLVLNINETHFVINMDDEKTLEMKGATSVKYHDVVSGGEGVTLELTLRGKSRVSIEVLMLIFHNTNRSYPIAGLSDKVAGVAYRTEPRGWIDRRVFSEWLREDRCLRHDAHDRCHVLLMDNAAGHKPIDGAKTALEYKQIDIRVLPPNSTNLCQSADTNVV